MAKGAYIGVETTTYLNSIGDLAVGSIVKINENGSPVDYIVVQQGNPDPLLYDASCDGTWVLRKDLYTQAVWHTSNSNKYTESQIHNQLNANTGILSTFDEGVRNSIKQVKVPYAVGGGDSTVKQLADGLSVKVFLLSGCEVGFVVSESYGYLAQEGSKLDYFESSTGSSANQKRIAYLNGTALNWWLRSPHMGGSTSPIRVQPTGALGGASCTDSFGIRPAVILPPSLSLTNGVVTGAQAESVTQGVARKIKKGYVGVDSVARKIKKAYIGIGGVARPCWSGGELAYYGTITPLSSARYGLAATSVGDYALFGGGYNNSNSPPTFKTVDAYNGSLVRSSPSVFTTVRYNLAATNVGNYALFGGGYVTVESTNTVDAYTSSLVKSTATSLSSSRYMLAATAVGNYALFGGGRSSGDASSLKANVDAYDTSLTRTSATNLTKARASLQAGTVGDYAVFYSGQDTGATRYVDFYNSSLTHTSIDNADIPMTDSGSASVGKYVIFAGLGIGTTTAVAYDASLTFQLLDPLSQRRGCVGTTVGDFALFGGGSIAESTSPVDVYDASLTRTVTNSLGSGKDQLAATTVGNYALFGGGRGMSSPFATVDAYTVA